MLTALGFGMVLAFMTLIMTRRLSPLVALIAIPVLFGFLAGFDAPALGRMMLDGIAKLAPTGVMLMFAILYFGIMIDAGLFDPVVARVLRVVGNDPLKVVVGTAVLAAVVSLDGDGSTTYMITCASMLPLYRRLGLDALALTCVTILAGGVMNLTPWGGPLARAATALHVDPAEVFLPMIPVMAVGLAGVFAVAWVVGRRERARLGGLVTLERAQWREAAAGPRESAPATNAAFSQRAESAPTSDAALHDAIDAQAAVLRRPTRRAFNALLTLALMLALVGGVLPLPVLFMLAFAIALVANYPDLALQRERIAAHAANALPVVAVIFAAGVFTGILGGTGMVSAMSQSLLDVLPPEWTPHLAPITAALSLPFTFFISNDAFYYGVLPVLAEAASTAGIAPVEMARAALIGQPVHLLSPLVPSTYLLVGLAGVEFGDHQRFTLGWAIGVCMLMGVAALALGAFPLVR